MLGWRAPVTTTTGMTLSLASMPGVEHERTPVIVTRGVNGDHSHRE